MGAWLRALGLALVAGLMLGGPAHAKWLRAETQRFVVYSDGNEAVLREYAKLLEDFDTLLRYYHGVDSRRAPYRKLEIYLVGNSVDLNRARNLGRQVAGFYLASKDDIFAVAMRDRGGRNGDRNDIVFHEYTHHFMAQYDPFPYPAWLVEGWAEYFATTEIRGDQARVGDFSTGRAYTLRTEWIPLEALLSKHTYEISDGARDAYYAQAWLLTHYLYAHDERRKQLDAYKAALMTGETSVRAMEIATGMSLAELDRALKDYSNDGVVYRVHPLSQRVDYQVTVTTLPPSADDLLLENRRLMGGVSDEALPGLLRTIRERAAKYPSDRFAQTVLARAEVLYGDRAAGEAVLQGVLAANPSDAEALRLMARSKILAAEATDDAEVAARLSAEAQPYLVKANAAQRNSYQTFFYFAQSKVYDADYPTDNTLKLLLDAQKVAPQVDSITFQAAQALVLRKDFDRASPMLERLANDPHGGGMATAARTLLNQISSYTGEK